MTKEKKKSTLADKIWTVVGIILCVLLAIVAIWLGVNKFILKNSVPKLGDYAILRVATGSMTPEIYENDIILIKDTGDYGLQDIITFLPKGEVTPTTHRIIRYDDNGDYITKGDYKGNSEDIEHINKSQVIGEVVTIWHTGLALTWFLEMGWIYLLAMVLIVVLGIVLLKYDEAERRAKWAEMQASGGESGEAISGRENTEATGDKSDAENDFENNNNQDN